MGSAVTGMSRFAVRFLEPIGQHGLGIGRRPAIGKHLLQTGVVDMQLCTRVQSCSALRFEFAAFGDFVFDGRLAHSVEIEPRFLEPLSQATSYRYSICLFMS